MAIDLALLAYLAASALILPFFAYLGLVSASALIRRRPRPEATPTASRFLILIPAHDEQESIAATVRSCRSVSYDPGLFRVLVIADNCTDRTAEAACAAGAEVVERFDRDRRSKGYAIEDVLKPEVLGDADAVVVIDADTVVDPDLLADFSGAIASGYDWIQCYYTVRNPDASWRTRMMTYAFSLFNGVALMGQEGLGLGAGLKGNGMCFTARGLARVPWTAFGLVEDMEFSWRLHSRGERIHFLPRSRVYGEMVSRGGAAAASQRRRWEAGRRSIPRKYLGVVARSPALGPYRKAMYIIQLLFPPLVTLVATFLLAASVHPAAMVAPGLLPLSRALLPIHGAMAAVLVAYVLCPVLVMGLPPRYMADLLLVPYYAAWKLAVSFGRAPSSWVRTRRETAPGPAGGPRS
jgi:cellulose synthase/poly-beta-1,6-N-acetylglucosamine synthase-like glycosyltransferase